MFLEKLVTTVKSENTSSNFVKNVIVTMIIKICEFKYVLS
jgi:hypothetical protein